MSRTQDVQTMTADGDDVTYMFAQDALAAALRYLFATEDDRRTEVLRTVTAVDVAWEVAPASERRRTVLAPDTIDATLALAAERWLPRAKELGVVGVRLVDEERPSIIARLLAKDLLPYLFRPALPGVAHMNSELMTG